MSELLFRRKTTLGFGYPPDYRSVRISLYATGSVVVERPRWFCLGWRPFAIGTWKDDLRLDLARVSNGASLNDDTWCGATRGRIIEFLHDETKRQADRVDRARAVLSDHQNRYTILYKMRGER